MGYTVRLAANEADRSEQAWVGIVNDPKKARAFVQRLSRLPELRQPSSVSGEVEDVALLRAQCTPRLDALPDEIGEVVDVMRTTSSAVLAVRVDRSA